MSLPEPRHIVIQTPMIARYRHFNPLRILVPIPISQHYPSFVTARTQVVGTVMSPQTLSSLSLGGS